LPRGSQSGRSHSDRQGDGRRRRVSRSQRSYSFASGGLRCEPWFQGPSCPSSSRQLHTNLHGVAHPRRIHQECCFVASGSIPTSATREFAAIALPPWWFPRGDGRAATDAKLHGRRLNAHSRYDMCVPMHAWLRYRVGRVCTDRSRQYATLGVASAWLGHGWFATRCNGQPCGCRRHAFRSHDAHEHEHRRHLAHGLASWTRDRPCTLGVWTSRQRSSRHAPENLLLGWHEWERSCCEASRCGARDI